MRPLATLLIAAPIAFAAGMAIDYWLSAPSPTPETVYTFALEHQRTACDGRHCHAEYVLTARELQDLAKGITLRGFGP